MTSAEQDTPLPLIAHLTELRDRLLRMLLAVLIAFIVPIQTVGPATRA